MDLAPAWCGAFRGLATIPCQGPSDVRKVRQDRDRFLYRGSLLLARACPLTVATGENKNKDHRKQQASGNWAQQAQTFPCLAFSNCFKYLKYLVCTAGRTALPTMHVRGASDARLVQECLSIELCSGRSSPSRPKHRPSNPASTLMRALPLLVSNGDC